jgi:PAS domain S-box-containing protein
MSMQKKDKRILPDSKKPNSQRNAKRAADKEMNRLVRELKQTEEKYGNIVENIGVGVAMIDPAMRILTLNRQMREWFPDVNPSVKPLCYESFNDPPARDVCPYCPTINTLRDGQVHETVTNTPSGEEVKHYRIIATPVTDSKGRVVAAIEMVEDITERKQAAEALRASEQRHRSYIELTGQFGWTTNAEGKLEEDLPAWRMFTGQSEEEIKGAGWAKALHPDDVERALEAWNKAVAAKSPYEIEYRVRRHDGVYRHWLVRSVPLFRENGSIREWIGTSIDITDRKRAEEALMASTEELKAKTRALEEMNAALRVLLKQREEDKNDLEERILASVNELVIPHLGELKKCLSGQTELTHVHILESNLQGIISPFAQKLSMQFLHLTQKEIQIANLIKEGKTTKEIARFMDLSKFAIDTHRAHLRSKLGLTNKKANLRTYLSSIAK